VSPTVLVTGATGFIGRHLVPAVLAQDFRVRVAVRNARQAGVFGPEVETAIAGDLREEIDWTPHLRGADAVVHLAGLAHTGSGAETEPLFDEINHLATMRLARAVRDAGLRLVFVSSVRAQSGPCASGILTEATTPAPIDAYGRSKLAAERGIEALGGAYVILRPTLVYGPSVGGNMGLLLRMAALPIPLPFAGVRNARSLLAVENLIAAIEFGLRSEAMLGGTFLVADAAPVSLAEIIAGLRAGMGRGPGLFPVPSGALGGAFRLIGQHSAWSRLSGDLAVSTARLKSVGYAPPLTTGRALAAVGAAFISR
jgi:nucleoside-diphosphate-sugar epimerase